MNEVNPIPKPKRKPKKSREPNPQKQQRIVDPDALTAARRTYCQYCGLGVGDNGHVHHIQTKGAGHDDVEDNLIYLCKAHHAASHSGQIKKQDLYDMLEMDRRGS